MTIPLNYSLRALWLRKSTTIGTAIGIGMVVFVLASSSMLAAGLERTLLTAGKAGRVIVIGEDAFDESTSRMKQDIATLVKAAPGVARAADAQPLVSEEAVVHLYLGKGGDADELASVQVRGVPGNVFAVRPEARIVAGRALQSGTAEAVVGTGLLDRFEGLTLGGSIELQKGRRATIVGVVAADGSAYESEVWVDLDVLRSAFGSSGYLSSVTATLGSPSEFERLAADLASDPRRGIKVERETQYYERISSRLGAIISGLGGMVSLIFSIGAMLGAMITMYASVDQRQKEIGTLRAIGFSPGQVSFAFLLEAGALALAGGGIGVFFASFTPLLDFSTINYATGQEVAFQFMPSAASLLGPLLAGALVGLLGGLLPALKAARGNPVDALQASR